MYHSIIQMLLRSYEHFIQTIVINKQPKHAIWKRHRRYLLGYYKHSFSAKKCAVNFVCVCTLRILWQCMVYTVHSALHCTVYSEDLFWDGHWSLVITNSTGQPEMSGRLIHVYVFLRDARHLSVKGIFRDKHLMYSQVHTCKIN